MDHTCPQGRQAIAPEDFREDIMRSVMKVQELAHSSEGQVGCGHVGMEARRAAGEGHGER